MSHVSTALIGGGGGGGPGEHPPPLPPGLGGGGGAPRVSRPRPLHRGLWGVDEWHFRLCVDIYVHSGISKGGTQKKHFFLVWASREGHNEQTLSFSTEYSKNHLVKIMFF